MDPFRFLICGCGGAGLAAAHVAVDDGRGAIAGLFDPLEAQLARAQSRYPDAVAGSDYARVLDSAGADAVVVAGPDYLHAEQAIVALERGAHLLVEKPLATSSADCQRIIDAAAQAGRIVMVDHTMRYLYPWGDTVAAAKAGKVGEVFFVQGDYIHDMWDWYHPDGKHHTPWRIDAADPQNILLGGGCHPIDLMLWTVGAPVAEVFCYASKMSIREFPSEDCYVLSMRFDNGVLAKCFVTSGCSGHGMGGGMLAVYGTEGTLWDGKLYRRHEEPVALEDTSGDAAVAGHGWGGAVRDYLDVLEGKMENPIPAEAGARVVSVCEAGLESIRTGQPQKPVWF